MDVQGGRELRRLLNLSRTDCRTSDEELTCALLEGALWHGYSSGYISYYYVIE
jgi:hypothetical protein